MEEIQEEHAEGEKPWEENSVEDDEESVPISEEKEELRKCNSALEEIVARRKVKAENLAKKKEEAKKKAEEKEKEIQRLQQNYSKIYM